MDNKTKYILPIIILLSLTSPFFLFQKSHKDEISSRKKELENLRKQIDEFEERLHKSEVKEKSTLELIDKYDGKAILINRLINHLNEDIESQEKEVSKIEEDIKNAEFRLGYLKNDYSRYIISIYKRGRIRDLELVLSASSLNQMYIRLEYLRRFTEHRKNELSKIVAQKDTIDIIAVMLREKLDEKKLLLVDKTKEEENLNKLTESRQLALKNIRKDKENYKKELDRRNKAAKDLERIINSLITEEKAKKESRTEKKEPATADRKSKSDFSFKKGRLLWPVNGNILNHYGNKVNPNLGTVTLNNGVDISIPAGTNVKSVANGEVSKISFIPGFGSLVIINHYDGYRTVYAHLSQILVKEEQLVKEGQIIAKSGESLSGSILHFQIWKNKDHMNPETWLTSR
jgi:septal ring factor EnvC (AmiA/AmiB activator)